MKIYAFAFKCIQNDSTAVGVEIDVCSDGLESQKRIIDYIEKKYSNIRPGSVKIVATKTMPLQDFINRLKPEFEKLVKVSKIKSELMDTISKLPLD